MAAQCNRARNMFRPVAWFLRCECYIGHPRPAVTIRARPSAKVTLALVTRAGAGALNNGSSEPCR